MQNHLHHVHVFATDIDASIVWYQDMLGGEVAFDGDFGGTRNVFMRIGSGRLHLYDQPPKGEATGPIHHLGVRTDDLAKLVVELETKGLQLRSPIRDFGSWKYIMCAAPDNVLLELFEIDVAAMPGPLVKYFDDPTSK